MILWNQFWGVGPSAHDSGFPRRRRVSAEGEKIILCIMLCVFVYLARTFVSHVHAQLFHMWISTAFILMQSFCHWCHSRFGHQGHSFSIHRLARHYHWVLKYFGVRKKRASFSRRLEATGANKSALRVQKKGLFSLLDSGQASRRRWNLSWVRNPVVCIGGEELECMLNEGDQGTKVG